ncbi:Endonuclease/exonuclease/phosphatase [Trinorchestia longiramus]|nr:Endonuclease/exonuclease/phosphatase [Trinorchestia longiramus]
MWVDLESCKGLTEMNQNERNELVFDCKKCMVDEKVKMADVNIKEDIKRLKAESVSLRRELEDGMTSSPGGNGLLENGSEATVNAIMKVVDGERKKNVRLAVNYKQGGGVVLIVKNALNWKLEEICVGNELESEDILVKKCEKVPANNCIILVVCYMTTMGSLVQEENVKKYTVLERAVQEFSRFPVNVMGDMNGHVGILGEKVNENGHKLIDFCEGNEFENLNVTIGNGLHTWESKGWKAAVDDVLVNHEARYHVREMYMDENEFDIDTDHRMLFLGTNGVEERLCKQRAV